MVLLALAGSGFLVASRFLSITPILHFLKNGNRASFLPALNLSQISEFSLIIGALGVGLGHIDQRVLSVIIFMLVITSVFSTYCILYSHPIFQWVNPLLRRMGMRDLDEESAEEEGAPARPIIFLGFARHASSLLHELLAEDPGLADQIAVIDFNPYVKKELDHRGIQCIYGDVGHVDTLRHAHVHHARVLLSTIPDQFLKGTTNERMLRQLSELAPEARIIVTAEALSQARDLYQEGAAFVFLPRLMGARDLRDAALAALKGNLEEKRRVANAQLEARSEVLP